MSKMNMLLLSTFLLLALPIQSRLTNKCPSKLLQKCICGKEYFELHEKYVVRCQDQKFTDVSMLKELPEEIDVLIFTGNHITTLPWNIFGDFNNLSMLKYIDMSNNGIREIKGKTYHHVPNVETLILNHNNLSISSLDEKNYHHPRVFSNFINLKELHLTNAFADNTDEELADDLHDIFVNSELKKLFKLHLEQNEIRFFRDANVFCELPAIGDIYLGDNYLSKINFNISCLKNLRFLDLEKNNISKLSQRDLDALDMIANQKNRKSNLTIDLTSNPFKCNSDIKNLYMWLHETNVTVRRKEDLKCYQPKYGYKNMYTLKALGEAKHAKLSMAVNILLVILVLILISLLSAYGYLKRDKLKTKLAPMFDVVTRKVQYTTIDSQDV